MPFIKQAAKHWTMLTLLCAFLIMPPEQGRALNLCGILCSCTITGSSVTLINYNPINNTDVTGTATVTVGCQLLGGILSLLQPFSIELNKGQLASSFSARQMQGPTATRLNYNLFSDFGMGTIWGDGTGGSQLLNDSLSLSIPNLIVPQIETVYVKIPGGQNVPPGTYTDSVTATLIF